VCDNPLSCPHSHLGVPVRVCVYIVFPQCVQAMMGRGLGGCSALVSVCRGEGGEGCRPWAVDDALPLSGSCGVARVCVCVVLGCRLTLSDLCETINLDRLYCCAYLP
jgi:hypothetical protein